MGDDEDRDAVHRGPESQRFHEPDAAGIAGEVGDVVEDDDAGTRSVNLVEDRMLQECDEIVLERRRYCDVQFELRPMELEPALYGQLAGDRGRAE